MELHFTYLDNEMSVVSIIVLTFNSERYIDRCLSSLIEQRWNDFEVLVVDGGSTDATREIVQKFDHRFRWLELPGSDMGSARNYGVRHSRGKYLMFLDSDDFYLPEKLAYQVGEMEADASLGVHFCAAWHFRTQDPLHVGMKRLGVQPIGLKDYIAGYNHNLNAMCVRRSVWESGYAFGEGERGRYGEEWILQLAMARGGVTMKFDAEPLVVAELRPDSHTVWSRQWVMQEQKIAELRRVDVLLTSAQRAMIDIPEVIDGLRAKMVIAMLLDGRKAQARAALTEIEQPKRRFLSQSLVLSSWLVPVRLLSWLLRTVWLWKQNKSFVWIPTQANILRQIRGATAGMGTTNNG